MGTLKENMDYQEWIETAIELPPQDGVYLIAKDRVEEEKGVLVSYDGYGFIYAAKYIEKNEYPNYWKKPKKKHGKQ